VEGAGKPQEEAEFQWLPEPRFPWKKVFLVATLYLASTAAFLRFTPKDPSDATFWKLTGWGALALSIGTLHLYPILRKSLKYSSRFKAHSKPRIDLGAIILLIALLVVLLLGIITEYILPNRTVSSYLGPLAGFLMPMGFVWLAYYSIRSPSLRWATSELLEKELNTRFSFTASFLSFITACILVYIPPLLAEFVISALVVIAFVIMTLLLLSSILVEAKMSDPRSRKFAKLPLSLLLLQAILVVVVFVVVFVIGFGEIMHETFPFLVKVYNNLQGVAVIAASIAFMFKPPFDRFFGWLISHFSAPPPPEVGVYRSGWSGLDGLLLSCLLERKAEKGVNVEGAFVAFADANSRGGQSGGLLYASGRARLVKRRDDSPSGLRVYIPGERSALLDAYLKLGSGFAGVSRLIVLLALRYTFPPKGTLTETHVLLVEPGEERVEELFRFAGEPSGLKLALSRAEPQATP